MLLTANFLFKPYGPSNASYGLVGVDNRSNGMELTCVDESMSGGYLPN